MTEQAEPVPPLSFSGILRDARDEDMGAIQAIYAHHVLHGLGSFEEVPPSFDDMKARRAAVLAAGLPWLVAEIDGHIAGYAYAGPFRPRAAYRYAVEDSVYIAPDFTRRGVGHALLTELIARCEAGPWRQMLAVIGDSGNQGSVGLHRALGFSPVGTFASVGFKFGRWVDVVLMQRPLGAGDARLPE
jgi:phosphinothricin acetyltransferase